MEGIVETDAEYMCGIPRGQEHYADGNAKSGLRIADLDQVSSPFISSSKQSNPTCCAMGGSNSSLPKRKNRGAKKAVTIWELKQLRKDFSPNFIFLSESKSNDSEIRDLAKLINFPNVETGPAHGSASGLPFCGKTYLN